MSATNQAPATMAPATMAPAVNFTIVSRRDGWVTAVTSDGRTIRVSAGGNGR